MIKYFGPPGEEFARIVKFQAKGKTPEDIANAADVSVTAIVDLFEGYLDPDKVTFEEENRILRQLDMFPPHFVDSEDMGMRVLYGSLQV